MADGALVKIEESMRALTEATDLATVVELRDRAAAMSLYAAAKKSPEVANRAKEFQLRAARKAGQLLNGRPKNPGTRLFGGSSLEPPANIPTYAEMGIAKTQAHRWQQAAQVPEEKFERYIAETKAEEKELTCAAVQRLARPAHVSYSTGENEWYTPPQYIEAARQVMGDIDLDPASSEIANRIVGAKTYYTKEDDGLLHDWYGRVWMNPPYASDLIRVFASNLVKYVRRGYVPEACVLVNNATETNWFNVLLDVAACVCFIRGRVKFLDAAGNPSGAPLQGQALLYIGPNVRSFGRAFGKFGTVLYAGCDSQ